MNANFDIIIVGSGPAGVSAAFPLVEAGLKVLLVDGGRKTELTPPSMPYLTSRMEDVNQWQWMIGKEFHALRNDKADSPKFRTPIYSPIFEGFNALNKIKSNNFRIVGSLASGGLSNAWGCGVARLSREELNDFPIALPEIEHSYSVVTRRMGISGGVRDDLSEYFGLDDWADPPIQLDSMQSSLSDIYTKQRSNVLKSGVKLGRSRVAALNQNRGARKACDLSGNCLWGCSRRSLYSATEDLELLKRFPNFAYQGGFIVDRIVRAEKSGRLELRDAAGQTLQGEKVILAAGTLATTRLALQAIKLDKPVTIQSCPTAAFMLWMPGKFGAQRASTFGLGQLSFVIAMPEGISGFGSLFNTNGIPAAEFAKYMPLRKRYGIDVLKVLLSSCLVGNLFLPGNLTMVSVNLEADDSLHVEGEYRSEVAQLMSFAEQRLRKIFWKLGALVLPMSFTVGHPGSDVHYACSLPMRKHPVLGETNSSGELFGFNGLYVVDGASLSSLSEKSHTLTIMANADRIGRRLSIEIIGSRTCQI